MVDLPDPMTALAAWKTSVEAVKTTIDVLRSIIPASGGTKEQKQALEKALLTASSSAALADAELGRAFGYQLCKCALPPTPMLTVGYFNLKTALGNKEGDPVYECPKCGHNTAGPYIYKRRPDAPPQKNKG